MISNLSSRCRISLNGPRNQRAAPNYTVYVDRFTNMAWTTIAVAALILAAAFAVVSQGRDSNDFESYREFKCWNYWLSQKLRPKSSSFDQYQGVDNSIRAKVMA